VDTSQLIVGLEVAAVGAIATWLFRWASLKRDTRKVLAFLGASASEGTYVFRSNAAIAAATGLTELRVESVCARSKVIERNTRERQTWRLSKSESPHGH
jgi:hypothetical protein